MNSPKKTSKSIEKSTETNLCKYCSKPVYKTNMARHIYTKHPEYDQDVPMKRAIDCTICNKKYPSWWMNKHLQKQHPGTVIPVPSSSSITPSYSTEELLSMQSDPNEDTLLFDENIGQENKKDENKDFEEYLKRSRSPTPIYRTSIGEDRSFKGNKSINFVECPYCKKMFIDSEIFHHITICPEAPMSEPSKGGKKKTKRRRSKKRRSRRNNKK